MCWRASCCCVDWGCRSPRTYRSRGRLIRVQGGSNPPQAFAVCFAAVAVGDTFAFSWDGGVASACCASWRSTSTPRAAARAGVFSQVRKQVVFWVDSRRAAILVLLLRGQAAPATVRCFLYTTRWRPRSLGAGAVYLAWFLGGQIDRVVSFARHTSPASCWRCRWWQAGCDPRNRRRRRRRLATLSNDAPSMPPTTAPPDGRGDANGHGRLGSSVGAGGDVGGGVYGHRTLRTGTKYHAAGRRDQGGDSVRSR